MTARPKPVINSTQLPTTTGTGTGTRPGQTQARSTSTRGRTKVTGCSRSPSSSHPPMKGMTASTQPVEQTLPRNPRRPRRNNRRHLPATRTPCPRATRNRELAATVPPLRVIPTHHLRAIPTVLLLAIRLVRLPAMAHHPVRPQDTALPEPRPDTAHPPEPRPDTAHLRELLRDTARLREPTVLPQATPTHRQPVTRRPLLPLRESTAPRLQAILTPCLRVQARLGHHPRPECLPHRGRTTGLAVERTHPRPAHLPRHRLLPPRPLRSSRLHPLRA